VLIPELFIVHDPIPYVPKLRRNKAIKAYSTMPLLGREAGTKHDAEVLRDGPPPAHLEMFRKAAAIVSADYRPLRNLTTEDLQLLLA
jgi:hypothetical protein